jgi:hypothetical protein
MSKAKPTPAEKAAAEKAAEQTPAQTSPPVDHSPSTDEGSYRVTRNVCYQARMYRVGEVVSLSAADAVGMAAFIEKD